MGECLAEAQQAACASGKGVVWVGKYGALARVNLADPVNSLALEGKKFRGVRMGVLLGEGWSVASSA